MVVRRTNELPNLAPQRKQSLMRWNVLVFLVLAFAPSVAHAGGVPGLFLRGDANADGAVNLTDVIRTVYAVFDAGPSLECPDAADANDDGVVNIEDPVMTLAYLFDPSVPTLPAPFGIPGVDPTADSLFCGCVAEEDVDALLGFVMGSFGFCAPSFPLDLGIATVEVCNQLEPECDPQLGCPVDVMIASVTYDGASTTITVSGSIGVDPITFDTGGILGTCSGDIAADFDIVVLALTTPVGTDGVQFDDFVVTTTVSNLQVNLVNGTACFVISPAIALIQGLLIDQVTAAIDMAIEGLLTPNLVGLVVCTPVATR